MGEVTQFGIPEQWESFSSEFLEGGDNESFA